MTGKPSLTFAGCRNNACSSSMLSQIKLILGTNMMLFVFKQHTDITPHTTTAYYHGVLLLDITVIIICFRESLQAPVMKLLYQDKMTVPASGSLQRVHREVTDGCR